jgi:hypothetical protein
VLAKKGVSGDAVAREAADHGVCAEVRAKCLHFSKLWPTLRPPELAAPKPVREGGQGENDGGQAQGGDMEPESSAARVDPAAGRQAKRKSQASRRPSKRRCSKQTAVAQSPPHAPVPE